MFETCVIKIKWKKKQENTCELNGRWIFETV
jgi:hypothetical protein